MAGSNARCPSAATMLKEIHKNCSKERHLKAVQAAAANQSFMKACLPYGNMGPARQHMDEALFWFLRVILDETMREKVE